MRRFLPTLLLLALVAGLCGCRELDQLRLENKELKDKLEMAKDRIKNLEEQNALVKSDNDQLKTRLLDSAKKTTATGKSIGDMGPGVAVRTQGDRTIIELESKVFFKSGSSDITAHGQSALKRVAAALKKEFPNRLYRVEGHTDSDPIRRTKKLYKSNWELSTARALSVLHYLVEAERISPRQICAVGYGQYQPRVPNTSATNKSKNRRVEIVVVPQF